MRRTECILNSLQKDENLWKAPLVLLLLVVGLSSKSGVYICDDGKLLTSNLVHSAN